MLERGMKVSGPRNEESGSVSTGSEEGHAVRALVEAVEGWMESRR